MLNGNNHISYTGKEIFEVIINLIFRVVM